MNRLALVLAAAVLGTGCGSSSPPPPPPCFPSVLADWAFTDANGLVITSCATAGVRWVDAYVNAQGAARFDCTAAQGVVPLVPGTNVLDVEGVDASGAILYRDHFSLTTSSCGSQAPVHAQPSEGWVDVAYAVPNNACYAPGPSFIWVLVWDEIAGVYAADSASAPETNNTCGVDFPVSFRLASGTYTLISTEEVIRTNPAVFGAYTAVGKNCSPAGFTVGAAATTTLGPVLQDTTSFCP